jgi:hypothetical protein
MKSHGQGPLPTEAELDKFDERMTEIQVALEDLLFRVQKPVEASYEEAGAFRRLFRHWSK